MSKYRNALIMALVIIGYSIMTFFRNGVWSSELTLWKDNVYKSPLNSRPHAYLAVANAKAGNKEVAVGQFARALELDPYNIEAVYNLGVLYLEKRDYSKAALEFKKAISLRPDLPEPYRGIANLYIETRQYNLAADYLMGAIKLMPRAVWAYTSLAFSYAMMGELDRAESVLIEALAWSPDDPALSNSLGNVYMMKNMFEEAARYYTEAARTPLGGPEPLFNAAMAYEKLGNIKLAIEFYKRFISTRPAGYDDSIATARNRLTALGGL